MLRWILSLFRKPPPEPAPAQASKGRRPFERAWPINPPGGEGGPPRNEGWNRDTSAQRWRDEP